MFSSAFVAVLVIAAAAATVFGRVINLGWVKSFFLFLLVAAGGQILTNLVFLGIWNRLSFTTTHGIVILALICLVTLLMWLASRRRTP